MSFPYIFQYKNSDKKKKEEIIKKLQKAGKGSKSLEIAKRILGNSIGEKVEFKTKDYFFKDRIAINWVQIIQRKTPRSFGDHVY